MNGSLTAVGETVIQRVTYSIAGQATAVRVSGDPNPANNGLFYIHSDHLGSTSVLTKYSDGYIVNSSLTRYTPFGGYRSGGPSQITDRALTGQKENMALGLYYYNARYYLPGTGRFLSADVIVPDPMRPQSLNRFSYVENRPLNLVDPSGHCGADTTQILIDQCIAERDQLSAYYNVSFTGQWLLSEIRNVGLSLQDLEAGLGGIKYFQAKFSGVNLSRLTGTNTNPAKVEDFSTIKIWDNLFSSQTVDQVRFTIIHEFGHIWDARLMLGQSIGLQITTGGNTTGLGCNTPAEVTMESCTYKPNRNTLSDYSRENRRED